MRGKPTWGASIVAAVLTVAPVATVLLAGSPAAQAQGRAGTETEEDALFKKAEEQFNAGDYSNAADLYDQVIKLNPNRVEAFVKRATLYFSERNYNQAIELLTRAEKLSVSDLSLKTVLGLCFYESGQKDRGLTYLEDVVKQRPEAYQAQFQIGKHYSRIDQSRAITALETYFRFRPEDQRPKDPAAQLLLGTAYYLHGQLPEAEKQLLQAREARPRDNQTRQMLGTLYISQGRWAQGAEQYEPLQSEIDRRPAVAFNLATCYLRLGKRDEAKRLAGRYQTLRPQDPRGLLLLAAIDRASDKDADLRQAVSKYQVASESLKSAPADQQTKVNIAAALGRTYLQLKDVPRAMAAVEPALAEAPGKGGEVELLAVAIETKLAQMAQAHLGPGGAGVPANLASQGERLAELVTTDAGGLALAGSAVYASGNFERARRLFTDARQLDDKLPRARIGLARALEQIAIAEVSRVEERDSGRDKERAATDKSAKLKPAASDGRLAVLGTAVTLLRDAQRLDDSPSVNRNLAGIYLLLGQPLEAERVLTPVVSSGRADAAVWRMHARAQVLLGKTVVAQEAAERAVVEAKRQLEAIPAAESVRRTVAAQRLAETQVELAARYLSGDKESRDRLEKAVDVLEQAVKELSNSPEDKEVVRSAQRNLAIAYYRRGRQRLADTEAQVNKGGVNATSLKMAEEALTDLQDAIETGALEAAGHESGQALCLAALAAAQANQLKTARELVSKAQGAGCELVKPYSRIGTELLSVWVTYRSSTATAQREQLVRTLPRLQSKASGADSANLLRLLRALLYSANMALAYDYQQAGHSKLVGTTLRSAQKIAPNGGEDDLVLQHNLAVVDLNDGHSTGEKTLERIAPHPAESLVNLGILQDRRGQLKKALELYRKALERGARTPKLREWIDTKDRFLGQGGSSSGAGGQS